MQMHRTLDVCQLSNAQKETLCRDILTSSEYRLPIDSGTHLNYPCTREKITLTAREADNLKTDRFLLWLCPATEHSPEDKYYMGKGSLRDTVFIYKAAEMNRRYPSNNYYVPDVLVTKVDKKKLARIRTDDPNN